jgi:hypothetical protein
MGHPGRFTGFDELLKFQGPAEQAIEVVDDHRITLAGLQVGEHPPILRAVSSGIGGDIVVDIETANGPTLALGQCSAVFLLPSHTKPFTPRIVGDSAIDSG